MRGSLPEPRLIEFRGTLYRAFNPRWTAQPLSGEWAARFGGRFNRKGRPALYTTLEPSTALREVSRTRRMQPILFISYEATLIGVVDALGSGLDLALLGADDWQRRMDAEGTAPTQDLAETLITAGATGLLVPSFAPGARPEDLNLVLWSWTADTLRVIDDEKRLPG
jgi:RES domain-containing protein